MGDQLEINTQYELKKIARENNIQFEAFINQYGFSKEEPLMYFLSGDEIVSITWWAAKDQAKAQTTGFEQFKREVGLTFDYEKVSRQRDYVLSQQKKSAKNNNLKSNEVAPQKRTTVPNYKSNNSDSSSNYDNGGTGTLVFIIVLVIIIIFIIKTRDKKNSSGTAEKTNLNRTSTKRSFNKEYLELDKMMLSQESYSEVYPFIKTFREKLRVGEIYLEEMTMYIKNNFSNYDVGKIMFIISLFEQMEHIFGTYLNEWEKKNNSKFNGFEDVEQYHALSQKVIVVLQELLKEQIVNLGKKTIINNSSSDTNTQEDISISRNKNPKKKINNPFNIGDEMPPKIGGKLYKKDMSGLQVYFKKFSNMERIFNQFTSAIRNGYSEEEFLKKASLLDDEEIKLAATKGFNDISEFLENMLKLNENKELRRDYEACLKVLKILNKKRNFYELIEADASLEKSDEKISHGKSYGIFENWYDKDINDYERGEDEFFIVIDGKILTEGVDFDYNDIVWGAEKEIHRSYDKTEIKKLFEEIKRDSV